MWQDVFTILSNLAFLLPFATALELDHIFLAFVYLFQMLDSAAYHTCNSFSGVCFGLSPRFWRDSDFFWAQYIIVVSALNLIRFGNRWTRPVLMVLAGVVIFMLQRWIGESTWLQFGIAGVALLGLVIYWVVYAFRQWLRDRDQPSLLPPYRWRYLALGLLLSGLACSLYVTEMQNHTLYWAIHSVWHVDAALGQHFLLRAWEPRDFRDYNAAFLAKPVLSQAGASAASALPVALWHQQQQKLVHRTPASRV